MGRVQVQGYILNEKIREDLFLYAVNEEMENDIILNDSCPYDFIGLFETVQERITEAEGVKSYSDTKRRYGHYISIIDSCNIRIYYMNKKSTLEEAENCLASVFDGRYYTDKDLTGYSEYTITGYRINRCTIGNHDLYSEISSHVGEYIIFVLEW